MITDPTPSARSCQHGIFPASLHAGTTATTITQPQRKQISSIPMSCHGNQPDGKSMVRPWAWELYRR